MSPVGHTKEEHKSLFWCDLMDDGKGALADKTEWKYVSN